MRRSPSLQHQEQTLSPECSRQVDINTVKGRMVSGRWCLFIIVEARSGRNRYTSHCAESYIATKGAIWSWPVAPVATDRAQHAITASVCNSLRKTCRFCWQQEREKFYRGKRWPATADHKLISEMTLTKKRRLLIVPPM